MLCVVAGMSGDKLISVHGSMLLMDWNIHPFLYDREAKAGALFEEYGGEDWQVVVAAKQVVFKIVARCILNC